MGLLSDFLSSRGSTASSGSSGPSSSVEAHNRRLIEQARADNEAAERRHRELKPLYESMSGRKAAKTRDEVAYQNLKSEMQHFASIMQRTSDFRRSMTETMLPHVRGQAHSYEDLLARADRVRRYGTDVPQGQGGGGFGRQLALQGAAQGINTFAAATTLDRLPVIGSAIHSGVGTAVNASMMGAGLGTSLALGGVALLGAGAVGAIHQGFQSFQEEEELERRLGQVGGVSAGRGAIHRLRKMGALRSQIGQLGAGLGRATGEFEGLEQIYRADTAFGLGGSGIGLMGAAAGTGAKGEQSRLLRDAISAGFVSGLKQGRFHEMVDGLSHLIRQQTFGVSVTGESATGALGYMGALGQATGFKGSQLTGLMGAFDTAIRSRQGGFSSSLSFITAYSAMQANPALLAGLGVGGSGGAVSPFDVFEMQERGLLGKGGIGQKLVRDRLAYMKGQSGVEATDIAMSAGQLGGTPEQIEAAKRRLESFRFLVNKDLFQGQSFTAARQLTEGYLSQGGKLDDEAISKAMKEAAPKQDRAFESIIEQTGIQQRIAFGIEALGRSMPGAQSGSFNRLFEGLVSGVTGEGLTKYRTTSERLGDFDYNYATAGTAHMDEAARQAFIASQTTTYSSGYKSSHAGTITEDELARLRKFDVGQYSAASMLLEEGYEKSEYASEDIKGAAQIARKFMMDMKLGGEAPDAGGYSFWKGEFVSTPKSEQLAKYMTPEQLNLTSDRQEEMATAAFRMVDTLVAISSDPRFRSVQSGQVPQLTPGVDPMYSLLYMLSKNPQLPSSTANH